MDMMAFLGALEHDGGTVLYTGRRYHSADISGPTYFSTKADRASKYAEYGTRETGGGLMMRRKLKAGVKLKQMSEDDIAELKYDPAMMAQLKREGYAGAVSGDEYFLLHPERDTEHH